MTKTKGCKRFYSPEVEKLVRQLKEAREEKTAAMRAFKGRVRPAVASDLLVNVRRTALRPLRPPLPVLVTRRRHHRSD